MGTKYSFAVGVTGILGIVGDRIFSVNGLPAWEAPNECSEIKETSAISLKDAGSTPCAHAAGLNRRADRNQMHRPRRSSAIGTPVSDRSTSCVIEASIEGAAL